MTLPGEPDDKAVAVAMALRFEPLPEAKSRRGSAGRKVQIANESKGQRKPKHKHSSHQGPFAKRPKNDSNEGNAFRGLSLCLLSRFKLVSDLIHISI